MSAADLLSTLIAVLGLSNCIVHIVMVIKCTEKHGLRILMALGSLWLAIVFGLNSLHIVINATGLTGGRPGTVVILAASVFGAIYTLRNYRRC